jgi:hypothetical protein
MTVLPEKPVDQVRWKLLEERLNLPPSQHEATVIKRGDIGLTQVVILAWEGGSQRFGLVCGTDPPTAGLRRPPV